MAAAFDAPGRDRLKAVVAAWHGSAGLSREAFRAHLLDPYTSDATVDRLRNAARGMVEARTHEALDAAGKDLAAAVQQVGVGRWPRYLADAERRAVDAVSGGSVPGVTQASTAGTDSMAGMALGSLVLLYLMGRNGSSGVGTHQPTLPRSFPSALPPNLVAAVPVPPVKEGETPTDVLKPGGQLVGEPGSSTKIRVLPGGAPAAEELFDRLAKGGTDTTPSGYPGRRVRLPNGDTIGYRPKSTIRYRPEDTSGPPTIEIDIAGLGIKKLKFPE